MRADVITLCRGVRARILMLTLAMQLGRAESPPRVAHCIVGTAFETEFYLQSRQPIFDARNYASHAKWLQEVRGGNSPRKVDADLFLVLETRKMPRRSDFFHRENGTWFPSREGKLLAGMLGWIDEQSAEHGPDSRAWPWNRTDPSVFGPMIAALQPTRLVLHEENLLCVDRPCLCRSHNVETKGPSVSFWEMIAKNRGCLQAIEDEERRSGRTYDLVSKTRTDGDFITAAHVRMAALSHQPKAAAGKHIYIGQSATGCHGAGDWAALMPRSLAPAYFNMSHEVPCSFVVNHSQTFCGQQGPESYLWAWTERQARLQDAMVTKVDNIHGLVMAPALVPKNLQVPAVPKPNVQVQPRAQPAVPRGALRRPNRI